MLREGRHSDDSTQTASIRKTKERKKNKGRKKETNMSA